MPEKCNPAVKLPCRKLGADRIHLRSVARDNQLRSATCAHKIIENIGQVRGTLLLVLNPPGVSDAQRARAIMTKAACAVINVLCDPTGCVQDTTLPNTGQ